MKSEALKDLAVEALEDLKGDDITVLDVREQADFTDFMIVVSGTSQRHLKAMTGQLYLSSKKAGVPPISIEGEDSQEWMLVDLGDVVVHLMRPETRALYEIEKLWSLGKQRDASAS